MFLKENVQLALAGLIANKMRAALTMLGIIIGIGSVITIVTIGDSLSASVESEMSSMGVSNINVVLRSTASEQGLVQGAVEQSDLITDDMIDLLSELYSDKIRALSMTAIVGQGKSQEGALYANVTLSGVNIGHQTVNDIELLGGRFISKADIDMRRNVVVVSDRFISNIRLADPIGTEVKITVGNHTQKYTIVGVYKYEVDIFQADVAASEQDLRTDAYIPLSTAQQLSGKRGGYQNFTIMCAPGVDTNEFMSKITDFFYRYYKNNTRYEVMAFSMESIIDTMLSVLGTVSMAISIIAGISLLVGGIGVMNIMLVSVTERTREIGTRKALGARNSFIRVQFIVEAMIICAVGGIFGVVFGFILGGTASTLMGAPASPSYLVAALAVLFSMTIGVFFGYYPANKAAKLDPVEALRYE